MTFSRGDTVEVTGWPGIAWRVIGPETTPELDPDAFTCWECAGEGRIDDGECPFCDGHGAIDRPPDEDDYKEVETGRLMVCMVGDDRIFTYDPDELRPLDEGAYCRECGQIGCCHGRPITED